MENDCSYCDEAIGHDNSDKYIQCAKCGEIGEYANRTLKPHKPTRF